MSDDSDLLPTSHLGSASPPGSFDENGLWARGNQAARNNPGTNGSARLRRMVRACTTEEDVKAVFATLRGLAIGGDVQAIKLYLAYTIGQPVTQVELSGPDGEPNRVEVSTLVSVVLAALADDVEARVRVAAAMRAHQLGQPGSDDGPGNGG